MNFIKNLPFKHLEINEDTLKLHFLKNTVSESVKLINCGLDYLSKVDFTNDDLYYSLSFFNLSRGFELLMKCMICYKKYDTTKCNKSNNKHFPTHKEMKDYGHNLNSLKEEIVKNYQGLPRGKTSNQNMISQLKEDFDFISNDEKLIKILDIISKYGDKGRYYELDYVTLNKTKITKRNGNTYIEYETTNQKQNIINPKDEMTKFILDLLGKDTELHNEFYIDKQDGDLRNINKIWQKIIKRYINPCLNKYKEALSRQFSYGLLGNEARMQIN